MPPLAVCNVARVVPPHDDPGRHLRIGTRRLRRGRGGRRARPPDAAGAPRRRVLGGVRRSRLGGRPGRPPAHHPAGGHAHRLAPPEHLLVRDGARARAQRAARRLPARRGALDAPQRRRAGAARTGGGDPRRALERRVHRLPHDARQDPLRHAVPLGAHQRADGRQHRRRARHRLRGVPRPGRRRTSPPTATRFGATRCTPAAGPTRPSSSRRGSTRNARHRSAGNATASGSFTIARASARPAPAACRTGRATSCGRPASSPSRG